jgi:hypothetical protein
MPPPNPPDYSQPLFVADDVAYRERFDQLMDEARAAAAREGRPFDSKDINDAASTAAAFSRSTPFALACTAMIQGDRTLAEECCECERKERGDEAARALMQRFEKAVRDKLTLMAANRATRRSRNNHRR